MAEQTKKSKYNFGGHELDAKLYLQNIRDNAETFLNSKTDWTPEQKEEWKHAYTNFTNALQEDINNGGGRFSTDEFGTITDTKGEFSNTDSDNYYYNDKGQQISQEDYDALKKRKQGKYQAFEANRQFASYASQIGKGLREALAAKGKTSDGTNGFDYAKNGFDAYWQKKYNPAGTANDLQPYWNKDKEGEYTNRVAETIADLDDYMSKQEMNDDVKAAYTNYRNILGQYNPSDKNFNLDTWKNNMILAASRAGISGWNNGYFNIGSQSSASSEEKKKQAFDINDDEQALSYAGLTDQALAHPELRDTLLAQARRKYEQESQAIIDNDKAEQKQLQDAQNNKIWEQWLANEGRGYGDVSKRSGIKWYGNYRWSKNTDPEYQSAAGRQALKNLQAALAKTHWDSDAEGLFTPMKSVLSNGTVLNNLGEHLAYYLPMLRGMGAKFDDNFEEVTDNAGHKLWKVKNSKNKAGQYLYIWNKANGKLGTYRDVPFNVKKAEITKAFYGVKIQSKEEKEVAKQKENKKAINNPNTPEDKKRQLAGQRKPGDTEFTATDIARISAAGMDVASALSAFVPVYGTAASAGTGLVSSLTNFGADRFDKSVSAGDMWKNLGTNIAMDVVGLVPGFGTAGKAGKITKTLVKYVPKIVTALSAANALSPESRASWAKLASKESLTVRDWQNIAAGCSALAGVSRGAVGHFNAHTMAKGTKTKDFNITASDGKQYKVTAEQLETLKKQKSLEDINKEFKKLHPDAELNSFFRNGKWQQLRHLHFNNPQVKSVYDFDRLNNQGTFSNSNIWKVARENNLRGISLDVKNPYKNSLLKQSTPNNPSRNKYEGSRAKVKSKQQVTNSPLNNSPERYNYVRRSVQSNTGGEVKTWRDIFTKNHFYFKEGGSIQKLANGNNINGNPYGVLQAFGTYDPSNYLATYSGEQKGMQADGTYGTPYDSQGAGIGQGRIKTDKNYSTFTNESREKAKNIENQQLYKNYTDALVKSATDYLNTPEAERAVKWNRDNNEFLYWSEQFDNQYKEGDKGRFFSSPGVLNTSWKTTNNDSYNNPAGQQNDVISRIKAVRNDQQLARAHNDREKEGKRYFWEENGVKNWVDAANIDKLDKNKFSINLFGDSYGDDGTHWNDYKITANSQVTEAEKNKEKPGFKFNNPINKQLIIDMMDQVRVNNAINANNRIAATLKQSPILYDPQEDHRYVQSDLDAEMNGQQVAGQLTRTASHPITSDGNLQSMLQLEAVSKGNEAITQGRQVSNQRSREMQEQAWQQELVNHTSRHDVAMKNRESLYNTTNYNKQIDATNINANYTVEDARAQEAILPYKQDREIARAEQKSWKDRLAMRQIDDSLRLDLGKYASYYGLNPDDVQLWEDVYVNSSKTLDDIKKNPVLTRRWNNIKYTVGQIQSDLIGDYYGAPRSKYWTIRQSIPFFDYSNEVKAKKGAKLNLRKVREAAKGEKLAAAQLKAQTADADRFYKTTKDHIDRMYDAISRTMDYSRTKKKRKKKKNL